MTRSYKKIRLKKHRVYTVRDLVTAYSVTENTVSNWVQAGLKPSDNQKPFVFLGGVVNHFHDLRRSKTSINLLPGEFKCTGCKMAVVPTHFDVDPKPSLSGAPLLRAVCPECSAFMIKFGSDEDLAALNKNTNPNTSVGLAHERVKPRPACIGIEEPVSGSQNDRVIYAWQGYAGKYSQKTVDQHLAAIRFLDEALGSKPFDQLKSTSIGQIREQLKGFLIARDQNMKSKSTVSHLASHMRAFLVWLLKQDQFKHLPKDLPEYLDLPRSVYARSYERKQKLYPTLAEATELLVGMPSKTLVQKRQRAIFAIAFLGALRADTLISLHLKHLDLEGRKIIQDGTVSRTKNGKSLMISWFPIGTAFGDELVSWKVALTEIGCRPEDALFPEARLLDCPRKIMAEHRAAISPMASKHAVTQAFAQACRNLKIEYSPHSAKHTIAAERDNRALTSAQRAAWSQMMGHENEQITDRHYGKMSEQQRLEVFETISDSDGPRTGREMSDEEKIALVDAIMAYKKTHQ